MVKGCLPAAWIAAAMQPFRGGDRRIHRYAGAPKICRTFLQLKRKNRHILKRLPYATAAFFFFTDCFATIQLNGKESSFALDHRCRA